MTSKAKEALEYFISATGVTANSIDRGVYTIGMRPHGFIQQHHDTLLQALTILAAIEGGELERPDDPQRDGYDVGHTHGWNDCLEHLKNIGEKS